MTTKNEKQIGSAAIKKLKKGGKIFMRNGVAVARKTSMPKLNSALIEILKHLSLVAFIESNRKIVRVVYNDKHIREFRACMYQVKRRVRRRLIFDGHESFLINLALIESIHRSGKRMEVRFKKMKLVALVSSGKRDLFEARVWEVCKIRPS